MGKALLVQLHLGHIPLLIAGVGGIDQIGHGDVAGGQQAGVGLDAQIRRHLADDVAHQRGGQHGAELGLGVGFVHEGQHKDLGVVDGHHAHEAGHLLVLVGGALTGALVQLFTGARLAADVIARHIGVAARGAVRAAAHHVLHHAAQGGAGLLADDLTLGGGLELLHHVALVVHDLAHDVGLHQIAAVHHRADGGGHLDGGDLLGLTEAGGGKVHRGHGVHAVVGDALAGVLLGGQVDAGGLGEAKGGVIVGEYLLAHELGFLDGGDVAAVLQHLTQVLPAVHALDAVAVVGAGVVGAHHGVAAGAVEGGVDGGGAGIQQGAGGDELEHRAGGVKVGDGLVLPLALALLALHLGVLLPFQPFQQGGPLGVVEGHGVVGVKVRLGGHGQDGAGVHVHHDDHAPLGDIVYLDRVFQVFFGDGLYLGVQGEDEIIAVLGLVEHSVVVGHLAAGGGALAHQPPRRAGQHVLIVLFQAVEAVSVGVHEAQHAGGKGAEGVFPLGVLGDDEAELVVAGVLGNFIRHRLVHLLCQQHILLGIVDELVVNLLGVHAQDPGQVLADALYPVGPALRLGLVRLGAAHGLQLLFGKAGRLDLAGVGGDGPHDAALGQHLAGGIVDLAALGGDGHILHLLAGGGVQHLVVAHDLPGVEPPDQHAATHHQKQAQQHIAAHFQRAVHLIGGYVCVFVHPLASLSGPSPQRINANS